MSPLKLDHVNLVVSDIDQAKAFFELLGYQCYDQADIAGPWLANTVGLPNAAGHYAKLSHPASAVNIELLRYDEPRSPADANAGMPHGLGIRHLAFEVDDIQKTYRRLAEAGVEFISPVQCRPESGKKIVYFYGPDKILLELAEYTQAT